MRDGAERRPRAAGGQDLGPARAPPLVGRAWAGQARGAAKSAGAAAPHPGIGVVAAATASPAAGMEALEEAGGEGLEQLVGLLAQARATSRFRAGSCSATAAVVLEGGDQEVPLWLRQPPPP